MTLATNQGPRLASSRHLSTQVPPAYRKEIVESVCCGALKSKVVTGKQGYCCFLLLFGRKENEVSEAAIGKQGTKLGNHFPPCQRRCCCFPHRHLLVKHLYNRCIAKRNLGLWIHVCISAKMRVASYCVSLLKFIVEKAMRPRHRVPSRPAKSVRRQRPQQPSTSEQRLQLVTALSVALVEAEERAQCQDEEHAELTDILAEQMQSALALPSAADQSVQAHAAQRGYGSGYRGNGGMRCKAPSRARRD